jgi:Flp pilus assembly pilin Flp
VSDTFGGPLAFSENGSMRGFIALIVIAYLVGVGVALSSAMSNSASMSEFATSVGRALPGALAWPVSAHHSIAQ